MPGARSDTGGDRIEIRGLRVLGVHGVLPEERERAQPFELDIDVRLDLSRAGTTDALGDTVDYAALVATAAGVVRSGGFHLVERLADEVARSLLATDTRVEAVRVSVRKLRPPVPDDVRTVGVRVTRERDGSAPPS